MAKSGDIFVCQIERCGGATGTGWVGQRGRQTSCNVRDRPVCSRTSAAGNLQNWNQSPILVTTHSPLELWSVVQLPHMGNRSTEPALPRGHTAPGRHITPALKHHGAHRGTLLPSAAACTPLVSFSPGPPGACALPAGSPAGRRQLTLLLSMGLPHLSLSPQASHTSAPLPQTPSTSFFISLATKNQAAVMRGEHLLPVPNPHQLWGPGD